MSTKFVRLELSEKNLPLPKHGDLILNSMTQAREKWDSHLLSRPEFLMVCHGIPCVHIYFLFRTNDTLKEKKRYFDESDFCYCYGNFIESTIKVTESYLITTMFVCSKFFLYNCEVH